MNRIKNLLFREKYTFGAFGITLIVLMIYAIKEEIAPFGENAFLTMDMHGQYYPMMTQKLRDFFSVWSWNGSLGFSSAAQSAYYTNSLFLLLLAPFSGYARICALDLMIFFKLALASAFFVLFLEKKFGKYDVFSMVFGVAYGLSAYMTAYMLQPMWLDIVLLLPLILLALDRLTEGKNPISYILLLSLAIFSNFYIAWALCIFLVLWFAVSLIAEKRRPIRALGKTVSVFAVSSVLAGLLCAFSLFPLASHMENWISSSVGFDEPITWYHELSEIADSFSFGSSSSWEFGPANVFCGSAVLFFALLFLLNREISFRKRISFSVLAVFLFVSFECNLLDYIWHGLHFPNQLPARQSFLFVFLVLLMGYEAVISLRGSSASRLLFSFFCTCAFFLIGLQKSENMSGRWMTVLIFAEAFVSLIVLWVIKNKENLFRLVKGALAVVLLFDVCVNGLYVLCYDSRISDGAAYARNAEILNVYEQTYASGKNDFYRSEIAPNFTFNAGQLYGFKGVSYYSSTMNGEIYRLLERLGNRVYAKNVSTVFQPTPLQDMMFGVRCYYMQNGRSLSYANLLEKEGKLSVYESPYALPVAYAVSKDIFQIENTEKSGMELQEYFIRLASGLPSVMIHENFSTDQKLSNGMVSGDYIYARDKEGEVLYSVEFTADEKGIFFLELDFTVGNYEVYVNGYKKQSGACGSDPFIDVGNLSDGDTVSVTIKVKGYSYMIFGVRAYTIRESELKKSYQTLSDQGLQVRYVSDTVIEGTISVQQDGILYASIPAEKGWMVYIDGEKRETYDLGMGLLFCDIEAGTHTVEYRYHAPGLALGIAVSVVTAIALSIFCFFVWKNKTDRCLFGKR